jgi:type VI protein secretion system component VasK
MGLPILALLALSLSIGGIALRKGFLVWASVPVWVVLGIYINANYTWLAEAQWVFILLMGGIALGMVIEAIYTREKDTKSNDEDEEEIDEDTQQAINQRQSYEKQMARYRYITRGSRQPQSYRIENEAENILAKKRNR